MAQELTHPAIKDGWFAEISDTMWPGQAMSLKVEKFFTLKNPSTKMFWFSNLPLMVMF